MSFWLVPWDLVRPILCQPEVQRHEPQLHQSTDHITPQNMALHVLSTTKTQDVQICHLIPHTSRLYLLCGTQSCQPAPGRSQKYLHVNTWPLSAQGWIQFQCSRYIGIPSFLITLFNQNVAKVVCRRSRIWIIRNHSTQIGNRLLDISNVSIG